MSYWAKTYGPGTANAVALAENGDIIVAGERKGNALLTRLDRDGKVKWFKTYGGAKRDSFKDVKIAPNGDIIVAGYTESFGRRYRNVWVLKLDAEGNLKWQKIYGGSHSDGANAIAVANNGDIIVVGYTYSFGASVGEWPDVWVLRLDSEGNVIWQKTYGGKEEDRAYAAALASNGDIIIAGYTTSFGSGTPDYSNVWVLRLDSEGNVIWQRVYGGNKDDNATAVAVTPNDDIIIAGCTESFDVEKTNFWVIRLGSDGKVKWENSYGGEDIDIASAIAVNEENIIVVGFSESLGDDRSDIWVLNLDENGNIKWQRAYGGGKYDKAYAVAVDSDEAVIVTGVTKSFSGIWVLRISPSGNLPDCDFCKELNTQINATTAEVHNTDCKVFSGTLSRNKEDAFVKMGNSNIHIRTITPDIKTQYHLDVEEIKRQLISALDVSLPTLIESVEAPIKFTITNNLMDSLKVILNLSGNESFDFEAMTLEFPKLRNNQRVSKVLTVKPKYAGSFNIKIKIKAILKGIQLEAEKTFPFKVAEKIIPPTHETPLTPLTPTISRTSTTPVVEKPFFNPIESLQELYTELQYIGGGGFARVYKAKRKRDGKVVAVKIPKTLNPATGKAFVREISNWLHLQHQNIVELYDANVLPVPYLEMEYCDKPLSALRKPMDVQQAAMMVFNIAEGLKYAHSKGIIHRDLKPSNVLLKNGIPKISDWGLSKVMSESKSSTTTTSFTLLYAAPEQLSKSQFGHTDERTDIWALGVVFYELVTGKLPFDGSDLGEITFSILSKEPIPPSKLNPDASSVEPIIMKMLAKRKEDRYQSTEELQRDLAKILNLTLSEGLKKSRDIKTTVFYIGDLALVNLKLGNLSEALKYLIDLQLYTGGNNSDLNWLVDQVKLAAEEGVSLGEEAVMKADIIIHQIKMGR